MMYEYRRGYANRNRQKAAFSGICVARETTGPGAVDTLEQALVTFPAGRTCPVSLAGTHPREDARKNPWTTTTGGNIPAGLPPRGEEGLQMETSLRRKISQFRRYRARVSREATERVTFRQRGCLEVAGTGIDIVTTAIQGIDRTASQAGRVHAGQAG